ncbi:ABC transporter permease [Paraconexibacter sp. AEG42_29]|uniref:ABC transporter permease n=1 Tax=Paraconexibacter sp. AEG42_29 TaxID=2997339 RepID=UPI00339D6B99
MPRSWFALAPDRGPVSGSQRPGRARPRVPSCLSLAAGGGTCQRRHVPPNRLRFRRDPPGPVGCRAAAADDSAESAVARPSVCGGRRIAFPNAPRRSSPAGRESLAVDDSAESAAALRRICRGIALRWRSRHGQHARTRRFRGIARPPFRSSARRPPGRRPAPDAVASWSRRTGRSAGAVSDTLLRALAGVAFAAIAAGLAYRLRLGLAREIAVAALRAVVQLAVVGAAIVLVLVLEVEVEVEALALLFVAVMAATAGATAGGRLQGRHRARIRA